MTVILTQSLSSCWVTGRFLYCRTPAGSVTAPRALEAVLHDCSNGCSRSWNMRSRRPLTVGSRQVVCSTPGSWCGKGSRIATLSRAVVTSAERKRSCGQRAIICTF